MKTHSFLIMTLVIWAFSSAIAHADPDPTLGGRRHGGTKQKNAGPVSKNSGTIRGVCSIVESPSNPFPGPCVNTPLVLNDANGNEVVKMRTTNQGQFDFIAEKGKPYKIEPGSNFYEIVAPKGLIHGGDKVNLQLQQK